MNEWEELKSVLPIYHLQMIPTTTNNSSGLINAAWSSTTATLPLTESTSPSADATSHISTTALLLLADFMDSKHAEESGSWS